MGLSAKIIILGVVLSYPSTSSSLLFNPAPILSKAQTQQLLLPHSALQSDSFAVLSNMDLLCSAYSGDSDDEPETKPEPTPEHEISMLPLPKRQKLGYSNHPVLPPTYQCSHLLTESPVPGRYISKRERALLDSLPAAPGQDPNPSVVIPPALGSISDSDLPRNILSLLRQPKGHQQQSQIPKRISVALRSHTKAVNAIHWSPTHEKMGWNMAANIL